MNDDKWWLVVQAIKKPNESGLIPFGVAKSYKNNYSKIKKVVWRWFRLHLDRKDLSSRDKLILYALCERYSAKTFSSHDSLSYISKMLGMNRHTISKGLQHMMDVGLIWCAIDSDKKVLRSLKAGVQHKHFLFVGLGFMLGESREEIL